VTVNHIRKWRSVPTWCNNCDLLSQISLHVLGIYMPIFRSTGCTYCIWCSALGVVAVVLRSRCVVLCTVCKFVSDASHKNFYNFQCTNPSSTYHTMTKLWQFYYILEMIKWLQNYFLQLCIPWWWASEARNM